MSVPSADRQRPAGFFCCFKRSTVAPSLPDPRASLDRASAARMQQIAPEPAPSEPRSVVQTRRISVQTAEVATRPRGVRRNALDPSIAEVIPERLPAAPEVGIRTGLADASKLRRIDHVSKDQWHPTPPRAGREAEHGHARHAGLLPYVLDVHAPDRSWLAKWLGRQSWGTICLNLGEIAATLPAMPHSTDGPHAQFAGQWLILLDAVRYAHAHALSAGADPSTADDPLAHVLKDWSRSARASLLLASAYAINDQGAEAAIPLEDYRFHVALARGIGRSTGLTDRELEWVGKERQNFQAAVVQALQQIKPPSDAKFDQHLAIINQAFNACPPFGIAGLILVDGFKEAIQRGNLGFAKGPVIPVHVSRSEAQVPRAILLQAAEGIAALLDQGLIRQSAEPHHGTPGNNDEGALGTVLVALRRRPIHEQALERIGIRGEQARQLVSQLPDVKRRDIIAGALLGETDAHSARRLSQGVQVAWGTPDHKAALV